MMPSCSPLKRFTRFCSQLSMSLAARRCFPNNVSPSFLFPLRHFHGSRRPLKRP